MQKSVHKLVQKSGGASGHYGVQCGSNLNGLVVCSRRLNISLYVTSQAKDVKTSNKSENLQRFQRLELSHLGNQSELKGGNIILNQQYHEITGVDLLFDTL